ncbi:hypothetical protein PM082_023593 [Marasmius tenuissimus]|nr:hypothetical protein PM082_023593 [Marasmius tenuissimus]
MYVFLLSLRPKLDQLDGGNPFADHTNVSDASSKKFVEKDEEEIGLWMEELELKEVTAEKRPHPETSNSLVHASDLLRSGKFEETGPVPDRFSPELPNDEMRDLGSRFLDDTSNAGIPEFPLKPISYTDMTAPVFTNPFGNPNESFRPLSPLYNDEYIDLSDVFLQPGGYTASGFRSVRVQQQYPLGAQKNSTSPLNALFSVPKPRKSLHLTRPR